MTMRHAVYSGSLFNKFHKEKKFYKFLNDNLMHNGFKYKLGLNTDVLPFNPTEDCSSGGLYFCEESECHHFWDNYGKKVALIEIPDDAQVYVEENKFKADKLVLREIYDFENAPDELWISILEKDGSALAYVKEQNEELCKLAVRQNSCALQFVKEQNEAICKLAVRKDGFALKYVKEQNEELCKLAVQQNGNALHFVKEQNEEICKLSVQQNSNALQFVKEQNEKLCSLAVQHDGNVLKYVKEQNEEICKLAVKQDGYALQFVNNQTVGICAAAIYQNIDAIKYVKILTWVPSAIFFSVCLYLIVENHS